MIIRPVSRHCRRLLWAQHAHLRRALSTDAVNSQSVNEGVPQGVGGANQYGVATGVERGVTTSRGGAEVGVSGEAYEIAAWKRRQHIENTTSSYGANVEPHYKPSSLVTDPPTIDDVDVELLLASQAHFGHVTSLWNPANARYIFGVRQGIHIISLDVTLAHLRRAARIVSGVAQRGGIILFAGTRPGQASYVVRAAEASGQYHIFDRWTPGTLTNSAQTLSKCAVMAIDVFDKPVPELQRKLALLPIAKPDLVVCLNPLENYVLLQECSILGIPTIGIIDTDADATWVTYPIPANDDSLRCTGVIAGVLGNSAAHGRQIRLANAHRGKVEYSGVAALSLQEEELLEPEDGDGTEAGRRRRSSKSKRDRNTAKPSTETRRTQPSQTEKPGETKSESPIQQRMERILTPNNQPDPTDQTTMTPAEADSERQQAQAPSPDEVQTETSPSTPTEEERTMGVGSPGPNVAEHVQEEIRAKKTKSPPPRKQS